MRTSNYDKSPFVSVPGSSADACATGWDGVAERLSRRLAERSSGFRTIVVVECYPGVNEAEIIAALTSRLRPSLVVRAKEAMLPPEKIDDLVAAFLGGDDPVFGFISGLELPEFFDPASVEQIRTRILNTDGLVLVVGCGAALLAPNGVLVYADLARWEAQLRFRRHESANLGVDNHGLKPSLQYKRAFFVDWRVADRWKRPLIWRWDYLLDTHAPGQPKIVEGEAVRRGLREAVARPFRVVPFFDPAPWGGQWMKEVCNLDPGVPNYGWCFDCVPEENSLVLDFGGTRIELPSIDLVFAHPRALLGEEVYNRFGAEFPIRFDFLDTVGGGNLSFQVHPLTDYIRRHFGMAYTQDESYYLLDAGPGAHVYLGLQENVDPTRMAADLRAAQAGREPFDVDRYAVRWPVSKHDHLLIPAGTVHCSGAESMVLEISATPYIFTFKLWDWERLGLDGRPRPIHLDHGLENFRWDRTGLMAREELINRFEPIASGDGWREERTGLHESEFVETRRHWFTKMVQHDTRDGVNVLNLVEGTEAIVESPTGAFEPFTVHYAETFIVPAAVGAYSVRPSDGTPATECATLKAFVRT